MVRYVVNRLLTIVPVLLGVSIVVFLMIHLAPGDVTSALTGPMASEAVKEAIRKSLGLDKPIPVQFLIWLGNLAQGDFGTSLVYKRAVSEFIFTKFFNTALLAVASAFLAFSGGDLRWRFRLGQGPYLDRPDKRWP